MKGIPSLLTRLQKQSLRAVIIPHYAPDADALGSALALSLYLKKRGHDTQVISPSDFPSFLSWMPETDKILRYEADCPRCAKALDEATDIFFVDFSAVKRMGITLQAVIAKSHAIKTVIDHHPGADKNIADHEIWCPFAAATAQLVFDLIHIANDEHLIDKNIAACLYAGILTDTGAFRFSATTSRVHYIVARLIQLGNLEVHTISDLLYNNSSIQRVQFLGFALSHCLFVKPDLRTAFFVLKSEDMQRFQPKSGDTEGLVNYALSIEGIHLGALIKEVKNEVRVSFRSTGNFAVNNLAKEYFNGGGHRNAAGGVCREPLNKVVERFEQLLPNYTKELDAEVVATRAQHSV